MKHDKRKPIVGVIPPPNLKRTYKSTSALEEKLREAKAAWELDCPPDFFTEPLSGSR